MWNFSEVYTQYIFVKTIKKFCLLSIFPECGIFQRSTLSTFRWNSWEVGSSIDIYWVWNFSEVHTVHSRWNSWGVLTFFVISQVWEYFRDPHSVHSRWNSGEVWTPIMIFWVWIFSKVDTQYIPIKPLRSLIFRRYFLSVNFSEVHT